MTALRLINLPAPASAHHNDCDARLAEKAKKLWPGSENYQRQWIRSILALRAGRGWVLEGARTDWHSTKL